ncbi:MULTISPECIES: acyl-CoA desaturase [Vibrio]|uniref:Acyl-CoA desaturase n=1 Tax=Vibrio genomosp. F6 str. FF-238 TaxID=1191298 RepID=A0A1E5D0Q8_9VIBR|nr:MULTISPECIES: fatty acid desaturase [Vibrio]MDN3699307.1 fatty acid desaturase [Vibrio cortegadensis]NOH83686.1 acyl-CoA desaturase [Vibrio sp. 03-59-1]OEE76931.1 acyl-CoA desaturase [Vibrio genomosp. F6 str. FF-238]RBW64406.1 acyl-CoA desaturase [Vibrionales bacterium C3R12]
MESSKKPPIMWLNVFIFSFSMLLAAVVAPWYGMTFGYGVEHWVWLLICFCFCNLSITTGYHRLWSHKAFESHAILRVLFALGGAFALQNSALHWSSDHRVHHKHVDNNDKDPYSAKLGFWYSHIGWMIRNYTEASYFDYENCRDLKKDKVLMWQHKHYILLAVIMNFGIPIALGLFYGDVWGMLLMVGAVRLVLNHHTTFFINSLAHIWGSQPYTDKNTARDNGFLAFLTFGEGYHNYHHIFENDYRNGIYWWQYDPTKWLIKSCSWLGLAGKLRKTPQARIEKARAQMSLKLAQDKIANLPNRQQISEKLQHEFDLLVEQMNEYYAVKKQLIENRKDSVVKKYEHSLLKVRYELIQKKFEQQKLNWSQMVAQYA